MLYSMGILLLLIIGIYCGPALALCPQWARQPKYWGAIPLLSIVIVTLVADALLAMQLFTVMSVRLFSVAMLLVAGWRVLSSDDVHREGLAKWLPTLMGVGFLLCFLLPYAIKLGTTGFDSADEIYSWHYWALQHTQQLAPNFQFTGVPYPQLFPKLIAWNYQLLGTTDWQLPVKACLIVVPFSLLMGIFAGRQARVSVSWQPFVLFVWVVVALNWQKYFDYAYADPLMAAFLVNSVVFLVRAATQRQVVGLNASLVLSVVFALGAVWTKQAALIWGLWALPIILFGFAWREKTQRKLWVTAAVACVLGCVWWLLGEGANFQNNTGVVQASLAGRDWGAQLLYACQRYLIQQPFFLVLLVLTAVATWSNSLLRTIFWLFVVPATVLWFMFGAYQWRLGMHLIAVMALLIVLTNYRFWPQLNYAASRLIRVPLLLACGSISMIASGWVYQHSLVAQYQLDWLNGPQVSLAKYFGSDHQVIYDRVYQSAGPVLVPAPYVYGLLYPNVQAKLLWHMVQPGVEYDVAALLEDIRHTGAGYVISTGRLQQGEPVSSVVEQAVQAYPQQFVALTTGDNRYGYKVYAATVLEK